MFLFCVFALISLFCVYLCRCIAAPLVLKNPWLTLRHPLYQRGPDIRPKSPTARDSRLPWILKLSPTFLRILPLWWNVLSSLTPWDPLLSLGFLRIKIGQIYSETLRIQLMNSLRSSTQMLDSSELNWSVGFEEKSLSSLQTTLQRSFASLDQQMWTSLHMMIDFLQWQIFFKFLELIMRSQLKAHPLELRSLNLY